MWHVWGMYCILVRKPEGRRHRWKDNIQMARGQVVGFREHDEACGSISVRNFLTN